MAEVRRIIILRASRAEAVNAWIARQSFHGEGGDATFDVPLWRTSHDPEVDPPAAYWTSWNIRPAWWTKLSDRVAAEGWKVNSTDNDNDISHYLASGFTAQEALDDTTRKPIALKIKGVAL